MKSKLFVLAALCSLTVLQASSAFANEGYCEGVGKAELFQDQLNTVYLCRAGEAAVTEFTVYQSQFLAKRKKDAPIATQVLFSLRTPLEDPMQQEEACTGNGGKVAEITSVATGEKLSLCKFNDFSGMELRTLARGSKYPGNAHMSEQLTIKRK